MNKFVILFLYPLLAVTVFPYTATGQILDPDIMDLYIDRFNEQDKELYVQHIPNRQTSFYPAIYRYLNVRTRTSRKSIISAGGLSENI